jgi:uncharacterized protein (TIGR02145 family)
MKARFMMCALAAAVVLVFGGMAAVSAQNTGTLTDKRDGKTYRTVKIGEQVWMAENLNYETGNSWCYGDNASNCKKYGRLYDWNTAMEGCPAGWHLPSRAEWTTLVNYAGGGSTAGKKLKTSSWGGTDDYVFSALPGSALDIDLGFEVLGSWGYWWTATEYTASHAYNRIMYSGYTSVDENYIYKDTGFSVRCLQD